MTEMHKVHEAREQFRDKFDEVSTDDGWMAAVWRVQDGKIELSRMTSWKFPIHDFVAAVHHLTAEMHAEILRVMPKPAGPPDPLPPAKEFKFFDGVPIDMANPNAVVPIDPPNQASVVSQDNVAKRKVGPMAGLRRSVDLDPLSFDLLPPSYEEGDEPDE